MRAKGYAHAQSHASLVPDEQFHPFAPGLAIGRWVGDQRSQGQRLSRRGGSHHLDDVVAAPLGAGHHGLVNLDFALQLLDYPLGLARPAHVEACIGLLAQLAALAKRPLA